jgi:hypothetical protein
MPRTQIPTKGGGRGSRDGKCNRGGRNARGGRGNDLQQSKAPTSTNERANEKTTNDSDWFQAAWRQTGHKDKDR